MHVVSLVRIRLIGYHEHSPSPVSLGKRPDISQLRIFDCVVYVPIALNQHTKNGPQRLEIYVGFYSPSIIRYLEPLTRDVFIARFAGCHLMRVYSHH